MEIIEAKALFDTNQPMKSAIGESQALTYDMIIGKSGDRWFIPTCENKADNILVSSTNNTDGFGGGFLTLNMSDGLQLKVQGPWHSNPRALKNDTGIDIANTHRMRWIIARATEGWEYGKPSTFIDVYELQDEPALCNFNHPRERANEIAKELGFDVVIAQKSDGGSMSGFTSVFKEFK